MPHPDRWLALDAVMDVTSLARSTVYDLIRQGNFPRPVKIGSASRWSESDVVGWMARRHMECASPRTAA